MTSRLITDILYCDNSYIAIDETGSELATLYAIRNNMALHLITHSQTICLFAWNNLYLVWDVFNDESINVRSFSNLQRCIKIDDEHRCIWFRQRNGHITYTDFSLSDIHLKPPYIYTGKCIWCNKSMPDVSFNTEPHIIPKSIGSREIGIDICDDCNNYFGSASKYAPNTNIVFREVFNCSLFFFASNNKKRANARRKICWTYFEYDNKTGIFRLKRTFPIITFTRVFKRSLYEVFLQKYHACYPDDNLDKFEAVRQFARYNHGNLKVLFARNKVIMHSDLRHDIQLPMSEHLKQEMERTGFFHFIFCGHHLFLEVLPLTASLSYPDCIREFYTSSVLPIDKDCGIFELDDIRKFDMFFNMVSHGIVDANNKLSFR